MTKNELVKCLYDYLTCVDHSCRECFAYKNIKFENGELYRTCELLNILKFGELVKEEKEN